VHFSTDYVFGQDVTRSSPWTEEDTPGPVSTYGISKLAGEHFVRSICDRHFVIRTCGLYGAWGAGGKGGNFIETMLRLAGSGRPVRVVNDQVCTPTYTRDLADAVVRLLHTGRFGLYHITSSGCCSWHQLATAIFQLSGLQVEAHPISTQEFGAAARRPAYSVLSNSRCELLGLPPMRSWREALADYLNERKRPVNN
jgi:dTDP-4-dehydrorhamnose reductase